MTPWGIPVLPTDSSCGDRLPRWEPGEGCRPAPRVPAALAKSVCLKGEEEKPIFIPPVTSEVVAAQAQSLGAVGTRGNRLGAGRGGQGAVPTGGCNLETAFNKKPSRLETRANSSSGKKTSR